MSKPNAIVVGFIPANKYSRFLSVIPDRKNFAENHSEYLHDYNQGVADLRAKGVPIHEVVVDPDELSAWCKKQGILANSLGRQSFYVFKFHALSTI